MTSNQLASEANDETKRHNVEIEKIQSRINDIQEYATKQHAEYEAKMANIEASYKEWYKKYQSGDLAERKRANLAMESLNQERNLYQQEWNAITADNNKRVNELEKAKLDVTSKYNQAVEELGIMQNFIKYTEVTAEQINKRNQIANSYALGKYQNETARELANAQIQFWNDSTLNSAVSAAASLEHAKAKLQQAQALTDRVGAQNFRDIVTGAEITKDIVSDVIRGVITKGLGTLIPNKKQRTETPQEQFENLFK